jgi:hypothetical protein
MLLGCAFAAAVAGGTVAVAGFDHDDGPVLERARDVGRDPFVRGAARAVPIRFTTLRELSRAADKAAEPQDDVRPRRVAAQTSKDKQRTTALQRRIDAVITTARRHRLTVDAPSSPAGAPLYGGSGRNACDTERLKRFFRMHPRQAAAWARVQDIEPSKIPEFIDDLTGGWLVTDTEVVNHGYADGRATPVRSILEAGTAVLVDDDSIPRVRCICGNPLREAKAELDGQLIDGRAFADAVIDAAIGRDVKDPHRDPSRALGPPNCDNDTFCWNDQAVSLGTATRRCQFFLALRFVDNTLVNDPGDDLRVIEYGDLEPTDVYVNVDGHWLYIGEIAGGDKSIDLSPALDAGTTVTDIRLCDAPDEDDSGLPGADIDAVAALHWRPV